MKKRIFLLLLSVFGLSLWTVAQSVTVGGVEYVCHESEGYAEATNYERGTVKELHIPASVLYNGVEYPVQVIQFNCSGDPDLTEVLIEAPATDYMGWGFFADCTALQKADLSGMQLSEIPGNSSGVAARLRR